MVGPVQPDGDAEPGDQQLRQLACSSRSHEPPCVGLRLFQMGQSNGKASSADPESDVLEDSPDRAVDPAEFAGGAAMVCQTHARRRLRPARAGDPDGSPDEKAGMPALERAAAMRPVKPWLVERQEMDHAFHGTQRPTGKCRGPRGGRSARPSSIPGPKRTSSPASTAPVVVDGVDGVRTDHCGVRQPTYERFTLAVQYSSTTRLSSSLTGAVPTPAYPTATCSGGFGPPPIGVPGCGEGVIVDRVAL